MVCWYWRPSAGGRSMPVSLHTHSWYSLLEGVSSPARLLTQAAQRGYHTLALTDTNNLNASVSFVEQASRHGLRPLLGACLRQGATRCVALIGEPAGYRNLCRVISRLNLGAGRESRPRGEQDDPAPPPTLVDLLRANANGLHVLVDETSLAQQLREAFGKRLWLEVVRPSRSRGPGRTESTLLHGASKLGIKPVASTAVHFATPGEYPLFRLVTAVRGNTLLTRLPARLNITPAHHLPDPEEFRQRFRDLPEAIRHGEELAELLRSNVLPDKLVLPRPRLPRGSSRGGGPFLEEYLHRLCERGLRQRDLGADLEARRRLREELTIIASAGLEGYFLTVRDITRSVRRRGHSMALRGSAGNSLVCYLLGITDVNPIRFGLSPERFLHPGRTDLPDIDLDFDWKVRDQVIDNVVRRYGASHTARISSHLFFQPRSAFREAGKIHGLSDEQVSTLLTTLEQRVDDLLLPPPGARPPADPWMQRLITGARGLLGRPHHLSLHPGGIVITPTPTEEYVPLQWAAKGVIMTQFEKDAIERVGLVKIDLLGNRALATVDEARRLVLVTACAEQEKKDLAPGGADSRPRDNKGPPRSGDERHPGNLALARQSNTAQALESDRDPATVGLLQRGDTLGVNQLESPAMRHLLIQMQPRCVEDVIQALALLRPGAASIGMKELFIQRRQASMGRSPLGGDPPPTGAIDLLPQTHGLILYEDDTLQVIQALTGLSAADADRLRKRIIHCEEEERESLKREFFLRCGQRIDLARRATLEEIWLQLSKFHRYAFCKSHAVSYGLLAWNAAYLKAHQPLAFWPAALNNNQGTYPRRVYIEAIKRAGLSLHLPCLNRSADGFQPEPPGGIRVGLGAIAGLPVEWRLGLLDERRRRGPFRDLLDVQRRTHPGRETLATLIRAGALDFTGKSRPALLLEADLQDRYREENELFPPDPTGGWTPPENPDIRQRLRDQWQLMGFVLGPPLFRLFHTRLPARSSPPLITSQQLPDHVGRLVRVQGLVATARHLSQSEKGRWAQFITLEDEQGFTEVTLFEGTCPQIPYLTLGPYEATGVVEERYGALTLTAHSFQR
jgi:DNA-directed DNA polymerase III PolC